MYDISIKEASIEELRLELERRGILQKDIPFPLPDDQIKENLFRIKLSIVKDVIDHSNNEDNEDSDHYLWESAMEAVYGPSIWKWWNQ
jgi:hypothetical protein